MESQIVSLSAKFPTLVTGRRIYVVFGPINQLLGHLNFVSFYSPDNNFEMNFIYTRCVFKFSVKIVWSAWKLKSSSSAISLIVSRRSERTKLGIVAMFSLVIEDGGLPHRGSSSTDSRLFLNWLNQIKTCDLFRHLSSGAIFNGLQVSAIDFPVLKQNFTQTPCSVLSFVEKSAENGKHVFTWQTVTVIFLE